MKSFIVVGLAHTRARIRTRRRGCVLSRRVWGHCRRSELGPGSSVLGSAAFTLTSSRLRSGGGEETPESKGADCVETTLRREIRLKISGQRSLRKRRNRCPHLKKCLARITVPPKRMLKRGPALYIGTI